MNVQKWVSFFRKNLLIGAITYFIIGILVQWQHLAATLHSYWPAALIQIFWLIVFGGLFSVLSQMGFFAYLTLHRIALGSFGSHSLWGKVQLVLIAITIFDLYFFRHPDFSKHGQLLSYILLPIILLVVSFIVAFFKKRATNAFAFIPTLFFMTVITVLEWLVGLFQRDLGIVWVIGITLMMCNAYQVLTLHKLTTKD